MFVDRAAELTTLNNEYKKGESSLVIIYGRRRVGKTALISEFLRQKKTGLYFLATEESEELNLRSFRNQAAQLTSNELLAESNASWETVFREIVKHKGAKKKIIVIDEFQYIGRSNPAFPSMIQKIWDTILKDANIMLILCGSLVASMRRQTLDYTSPLYGRRSAQIRLKQIPFANYHEFFRQKSDSELIPLFAVTGGVPKYIESFADTEDIFDGIKRKILNPQSYLYEEPFFLLRNEVNEIGSYYSIIRAISMNNHKLSEISSFLGVKQTGLSRYLKVLSELDIIEREVPATELNPEKSKNGLYQIRDNYLLFWFRFVYPYLSLLERGESEYVLSRIKKGFIQNHVSYIFEDICRERVSELAAKGYLPFVPSVCGRYWGKDCGETDIVAFTPGDNNLIIGECKYSTSQKGLKVFHALEEKASALKKLTGTNEVSYVIFSNSGYTKGLIDECERNDDLYLF